MQDDRERQESRRPGNCSSAEPVRADESEDNVRYQQFKNAGIKVSKMAVGTWAVGGEGRFGDDVAKNTIIEAIHAMFDNGVNLIDTAAGYGNGLSEHIVGEALASYGREKVYLSTKCGIPTREGYPNRDASYRGIMREISSSLRNLQTDHLDIYFVHWPDPNTPIHETMSALNVLKKQGRIRHIGLSNFSAEQIAEAQEWGEVDVIQPPFSMVQRQDEGLMKWAYERGIDSLTYGSLGGGILTGRFRELPNFDPVDVRGRFYPFFKEPGFSKVQELLKEMDAIAETHGKPVGQVAINWSTQKDYVGTALIGVRSVAHAVENCSTFDWELTAEEIARLDAKLDELHIGE